MATTYTNMVLKSWNSANDVFSYTELDANWSKVDVHDHSTGKGVQIPVGGIADNAITSAKILNDTIVNADINSAAGIVGTKLAANTITNDRIATADLQKLGLNDGANVRRSYLPIDTDQSTTSTTAGGVLLTTADKITLTVPNNSILYVFYSAWWKNSAASTGRARLYINNVAATVLNSSTWTSGSFIDGQATASTANYTFMGTAPSGSALLADFGNGVASPPAYPSNGVPLNPLNGGFGGPLAYRFDTGFTGDVDIRFWNNTAGTLNVQKRRLIVWTVGF